jgi:prepilin-type N-terminal cleavage/methylation domain-containing protein
MKQSNGFTLIELLVTISVMVILLTLTMASLSIYQENARDEERKTDVAGIAQQLELYYQRDIATQSSTGVYPATDQMDTEAEIKTTLPDLDVGALRGPSTTTASAASLIAATSSSTPSVASLNSGETYVYQPLDSSNALCASNLQECRKFKLYYTLETDPTVHTITSKHQ